jgi:fumarylacetoacetase
MSDMSYTGNGNRFILGTSNLKYLYWTPFQQITHHASALCGLGTGDLLGTGTISGDVRVAQFMIRYVLIIMSLLQAVDDEGNKRELGCLYEATQGGTKSVTLANGTQMKYLEDDDEIILDAWCGNADGREIALGFGECRGKLLPAFKT